MKEIAYQMANGQAITLQVSEEFYVEYQKIDKEYKTNEQKHNWRKRKRERSFEYLQEEKGFDIEDKNALLEEETINNEFLLTFLSLLTDSQKTIFKKVYIENKTLRRTAREMGIKLSNVQKQISSIHKKFLKNFCKIGGQKV